MNKRIKILITFFDESELEWTAPTEDRKMAIGILKGARWLENGEGADMEVYNTDYIFKWSVIEQVKK
jgi:hypothetical protein